MAKNPRQKIAFVMILLSMLLVQSCKTAETVQTPIPIETEIKATKTSIQASNTEIIPGEEKPLDELKNYYSSLDSFDVPDYMNRMMSFINEHSNDDYFWYSCPENNLKRCVYDNNTEQQGQFLYDAILDKTYPVDPLKDSGEPHGDIYFRSWNPSGDIFIFEIIYDQSNRGYGRGTQVIYHYDENSDSYVPSIFIPPNMDERETFAELGPGIQPSLAETRDKYAIIWSQDGEKIAVLYNDYAEIFILDYLGNILDIIEIQNYLHENQYEDWFDLLGWSTTGESIYISCSMRGTSVDDFDTLDVIQIDIHSQEYIKLDTYEDYPVGIITELVDDGLLLYQEYSVKRDGDNYSKITLYDFRNDMIVFSTLVLGGDLHIRNATHFVYFISKENSFLFEFNNDTLILYNQNNPQIITMPRWGNRLLGWNDELNGILFEKYPEGDKTESEFRILNLDSLYNAYNEYE